MLPVWRILERGDRRPPARRLSAVVSRVVVAVLLLVVATGCGTGAGGEGGPRRGGPGGGPGGGLEQSFVQVGLLPIIDFAAVQRAQTAGYFAAEGLTVEMVAVQGGAAAIPLLVNGELDFTWSAWNSAIAAHQRGVVDLRVLPESGYAAAQDTFVMMTLPDSPIRTPADLPGKKVAVNTLGSIARLAANSVMAANGVDSREVSYVEVPFPDMVAALGNRQVDAIVVVEPQLTQAATQFGAVAVLDVASGPTANLPEAGLVTTARFAAQNPNTVAAFRRAVAKAQADMNDRAVVENTLPTYTRIDAATAALLRVGVWPATVTPVDLQRVADLMHVDGALPERFDVTPLLLPPTPA